MSQLPNSKSNELLGYPADARLLIINADDLGISHASIEAILRAMRDGVVRSTSLMTPCAWALQAMCLLGENPDLPFGVHLTVISDMPFYKYRPLTCREKVPTLVDASGFFYSSKRIPEFLAQAALDELELEFRAQVETVLAAGLKPTHLDWHCLRNGGRADIFDLTFRLAREYGLAVRAYDHPFIDQLQAQGLPAVEHNLLDSYTLDTTDKSAQYIQLLRDLPAGLSEWAVHPALGNAEQQALEPDSWQVRQTDFEFLISEQAHETIRQEGIVLLNYKPLQQVWQG